MLVELFNLKNYYFNPYALPVFFTGLAVFSLGLTIFLKNKTVLKNKTFFFFTCSISLWLFFASINYFSQKSEVAFFWYKYFAYTGVLLASPLWYLASLSWSEELYRKYRKLAYFFLFLLMGVVLLNFHPNLILIDNRLHFYGYYVVFDSLGIITMFIPWLIPMILAILNVFNLFKKEKVPFKKIQLKFLFTGCLIGYLACNDFLPAIFPAKEIYPFGYFPFFLFVVLMTYAIIRYQLMDIKIILTEWLVGLMAIILLILPFLMPSLILKIFTLVIFLLFCFIGYLLIKTTYAESSKKESLEKTTQELKKLTEELDKKVKERTAELEEERASLEIKVKARTKELEELAQSLDEKVKERTKELQGKIDELERFHRLAVGRELKMIELKKEINKLQKELKK